MESPVEARNAGSGEHAAPGDPQARHPQVAGAGTWALAFAALHAFQGEPSQALILGPQQRDCGLHGFGVHRARGRLPFEQRADGAWGLQFADFHSVHSPLIATTSVETFRFMRRPWLNSRPRMVRS